MNVERELLSLFDDVPAMKAFLAKKGLKDETLVPFIAGVRLTVGMLGGDKEAKKRFELFIKENEEYLKKFLKDVEGGNL